MPHGFVLVEQPQEMDALLSLVDLEHVRAVVRDTAGAGLVFLHSEQNETIAEAADDLRGRLDGAALVGLTIGPIGPLPVAVGHLPGQCTVFAAVTLARGRHLSFAAHLRAQEAETEGCRQAAGIVLGCPDIHAMLEVTGEEWLTVLARLDQLTAHPDVVQVRTFPAAERHIRGAGSELAWGP